MSNDDALNILYAWMADWCRCDESWEDRRTALALAIEALREKNDREKKSKEIPFITMGKYI